MVKQQIRNNRSRWISLLAVLAIIQSVCHLPRAVASFQAKNTQTNLMAIMHWYTVGQDYDGSTLKRNRQFPWQATDETCWGRAGFPMTKGLNGPSTIPVFYTSVYVAINADDGASDNQERLYFVLDNSGSIWADPDGRFHNPHYDASQDPANPHFISGNCQQANQLEGRIRFSVDPFTGNNTQGPYSLQELLSERTIVMQYHGRRFLLGWLDREDFLENSSVQENDWDIGLPLISFQPSEKYVESSRVNGRFDAFEWIYRTNLLHSTVEAGDTRLSPVIIPGTETGYAPNTLVQAGDKDIGYHLNGFQSNEQHYDFFPFDGVYTNTQRLGMEFEPEFIYRTDHTEAIVHPGVIRLSTVNGKIIPKNGLPKDFGFSTQDALILTELAFTKTNQHYALETNYHELVQDLNLSVTASSASIGMKTASTSLAQGVVIDENPYVQISYIQDIAPLWAGYLGFEWFLDNGVNNKMANQSYRTAIPHNLSDDFLWNGESEEIWGQYSQSGDLDCNLSLTALPNAVRYYDLNGTGIGVNSPLYRDLDDSMSVSEGDERLTDVYVADVQNIAYLKGTVVSAGDADVPFPLLNCPPDVRFIDRHLTNPDFSNNNDLDIGEPIYKKGTLSVHQGWVEANDFRLTDVVLESKSYPKGTVVSPCSFYYRQSKVWGLSHHLSGNFRNLDTPVLKGMTPVTITKSSPLKVELTTTLTIQFDEPILKGQRAWIVIDGPTKRSDATQNTLFRQEISGPYQDSVTVSLTPYLGSYSEKGAEFPLSILVWKDDGGYALPLPILEDEVMKSYFYEPFYDNREKKYSPMLPKDFFPDAFILLEELVYPEDLLIQPSKKCISTFDSRFPNVWAKCIDFDNPDDVNDPYSVLASYPGNELVANYNAHGAGIEYYATTYGYLSSQPSMLRRFIVQVNSDRTYFIFFWNDKAPKGILNFGDTISNQPIVMNEIPIWKNLDCSEKFYLDQNDWLGYNWITRNDALGCFDNASHMISENPQLTLLEGLVETFGVNVMLSSYDSLSEGDPGGDFPIMLLPLLGEQSISLRLVTTSVQYDYNNTVQHPPDFIGAPYGSIQYRGFYQFKTPKIEDVNFTNLAIVDHALQYSEVNYTAGDNPLSPLDSPILASPYNPILMDFERDFIAYPAGQANVGRTGFRGGGNQLFRRSGMMGYNAYPSITAVTDPFSAFRKLGSENSPMTDYSFYFTLQNKSGEYYRFDEEAPSYLRVDKIIVEGPMKTTKIIKFEDGSVVPETGYPITYDYSGKLVIDRGISKWYQSIGEDWTGRIGFGKNEMFFNPFDYNPLLVRTRILDFTGFPYVFKIPEIIPTGGGRLHVVIHLADGTQVELGDCCSSTTDPGIRVHGLSVENVPNAIEMNMDHSLKPVLREYEDPQDSTYCNSAFVYLWQDRGIRLYASMLLDPIEMGAGDGRINMNNNEFSDLDLDGKISFGDFETEIIGTYDLATNTWKGGIYDARTFNVDNGVYPLELTAASNTQVTQFGSDFGRRTGKSFGRGSDHIISSDEECPVYITAYKFYDDNNDRAFTPLYRGQSHEVYLAGEKRILMQPSEDLLVDTYPSPLTAGCIPELIDKTTPLTFTVLDSTGKPMDFQFGVMDPQGESNVYTEDIHQHLFNDSPTEPLPQYYWTRTDLHNVDLGYDNNTDMYSKARESFAPIQVDFSKSNEGKYSFKNFCANDEGLFEVRVYSPDHLHMGRTWVRVVNPSVEFQISPMDIQGNRMQGMMSIRDPDFVMTAGVNRIYVMQIKAYNAQGQLIKGVDIKNPYRNPDEKDEIVHSGHFTPYTSKPGSFDLPLQFKEIPSPYYLHLMYPGTQERIELSYSLIFAIKGFGPEKEIFYNTTNVQYEDGLFSKTGKIEPNPTLLLQNGWGFGSIYNSPREGVYLFPDINDDKKLTREDSLQIGPDGIARVILFAEDVCHFGVLVGGNYFTDSEITGDIVGTPPGYADDPLTIRRRYRKVWDNLTGYGLSDGIFCLDWDAFPEIDRVISPPRLIIQDSETKFAFRRDLLSAINYDLVYAVPNSIHLIIQPADNRDLPITKGYIRLQGNTAESYVYGAIGPHGVENSTDIVFTPTGVGESIAHLLYTSNNQLYNRKEPLFDGPGQYAIDLVTSFDSVRALQITFPAGNKLLAGYNNELIIKVTEKGTNAPVQDATVSVSYSDYAKTFITNAQGEVTIHISPKENDSVRFYVIYKDALEQEVFLKAVSP